MVLSGGVPTLPCVCISSGEVVVSLTTVKLDDLSFEWANIEDMSPWHLGESKIKDEIPGRIFDSSSVQHK